MSVALLFPATERTKFTMYLTVLVSLVVVVASGPAGPRHQLLPHETDCGMYYVMTSRGRRIEIICPYGKLFDYKAQACMLPASVKCSNLSSVIPATTPQVSTEEALSTVPMPLYVDYLPNDCPVDHRFELRLPHDRYCYLYYECSKGQRVLKSCSSGDLFSYESQVCVEAHEADCAYTKGWTADGISTTEISQTTAQSQSTAVGNTESTTEVVHGSPLNEIDDYDDYYDDE